MALKKKTKKTNVRTRTELKVFEVFRYKHARAWQQGKEHLIANRLACLFTSATMGIVLGLPGLLFCFLEKTETFNDKTGPSYTITAFAVPELSLEDTVRFSEQWANDQRIERIEVVGKTKAFKEFKDNLGITARNNHLVNPFPNVVFFTLPGHKVGINEATDFHARLEKSAQISSVVSDIAWIRQSGNAMQFLKTSVLVLSILILTGAILVITQSTSYLVLRRQQEIRVQELIGATTNHIRLPFLYSGTMLGLGAGFIALIVIYAVLLAIGTPLSQLAASSNLNIPAIYPESKTILIVLGLSTLSGWTGACIGSTLGIKKTKSSL